MVPALLRMDNADVRRQFTVYIANGNNFVLVKNLFKRRPWVRLVSKKEKQEANLCWTQKSNPEFLAQLTPPEPTHLYFSKPFKPSKKRRDHFPVASTLFT